MRIPRVLFAAIVVAVVPARPALAQASKLRLELVGSDTTAFDVVSTLIIGPTEVLAWDAQYHVADARRLADRVAATGKRLKAIIISHPDHDHYAGAALLVERFPGTPVYMTAKGIEWYSKSARQEFGNEKSRNPANLADSLVTPRPLPSDQLTVDGERVELIPDLTGDVLAPTNSALWIPSLRAALVGDIAFNGVHPWLGSSDEASRAAWRASLQRIMDLRPAIVVAGHKKDVSSADTPEVLAFMNRYLTDFDSIRKASSDGETLRSAMMRRYPDLAVAGLLRYAAMRAYGPRGLLHRDRTRREDEPRR